MRLSILTFVVLTIAFGCSETPPAFDADAVARRLEDPDEAIRRATRRELLEHGVKRAGVMADVVADSVIDFVWSSNCGVAVLDLSAEALRPPGPGGRISCDVREVIRGEPRSRLDAHDDTCEPTEGDLGRCGLLLRELVRRKGEKLAIAVFQSMHFSGVKPPGARDFYVTLVAPLDDEGRTLALLRTRLRK